MWREVEEVGVGDVFRGLSRALVWGDIDPQGCGLGTCYAVAGSVS